MMKIRAFTVMELLIVMVISTILFGIAYFALNLMQKRYHYYDNYTAKVAEIARVRQLLTKDFAKSEYVQLAGEELHCVSDSVKVVYYLEDSLIIRTQQEQIDTFQIKMEDPSYFFLRKEVLNEVGLIDYFGFTHHYKKEEFVFSVSKQYDAATLIRAGF